MRKGNTLVPVIVAFAAVAAFLIIMYASLITTTSQRSTNTATTNTAPSVLAVENWQSYADTKLGFALKYPATWQAKACDDTGVYIAPDTIPCGMGQTGFSFIHSTTTLLPDQVVTKAQELLTDPTVSNVTLGGIVGKRIQGTMQADANGSTNFDSVYIVLGKDVWILSNDLPSQGQVFDLLLTTITFTNPDMGWIAYTNTKYDFSMKFPANWVQRNDYTGGASQITDNDYSFFNVSEAGDRATRSIMIIPSVRSEGDIIHHNTVAQWLFERSSNVLKQEPAIYASLTWTKVTLKDDSQVYLFLEHGKYFYQIIGSSADDSVIRAIVNTFTLAHPDEKLTDIGTGQPITKVTDIHTLFNLTEENRGEEAVVSVMGNRALIGGWQGKLFLYDGTKATDISSRLIRTDVSGLDEKNIIVRGIGNNGSYWLISTALPGASAKLYKFDGTTWTDLSSSPIYAANPGTGGARTLVWNGSYWLIGDNGGSLFKYDGNTFADLTSLLPANSDHPMIQDIAWNGKYFMVVLWQQGNTSALYKFDGTKMTHLTAFKDTATVQHIAWNGKVWLLGSIEPPYLMTYDDKKVTEITDKKLTDVISLAWVKSMWLVNGGLFDGKVFDNTFMPLNSLVWQTNISVGSNFGLMTDGYGNIFRFDF